MLSPNQRVDGEETTAIVGSCPDAEARREQKPGEVVRLKGLMSPGEEARPMMVASEAHGKCGLSRLCGAMRENQVRSGYGARAICV